MVNVQGDEPLIPETIIRQVADNLAHNDAPMATLAVEIDHADEVFNPNAVKVVTDKNGYAMYFSRASIPWDRDNFAKRPQEIHQNLMRHIGIYAYRAGFINTYINWEPSALEKKSRHWNNFACCGTAKEFMSKWLLMRRLPGLILQKTWKKYVS